MMKMKDFTDFDPQNHQYSFGLTGIHAIGQKVHFLCEKVLFREKSHDFIMKLWKYHKNARAQLFGDISLPAGAKSGAILRN